MKISSSDTHLALLILLEINFPRANIAFKKFPQLQLNCSNHRLEKKQSFIAVVASIATVERGIGLIARRFLQSQIQPLHKS